MNYHPVTARLRIKPNVTAGMVLFADEWEVAELSSHEQHYVPRPSPWVTQQSLKTYRNSRASFDSYSAEISVLHAPCVVFSTGSFRVNLALVYHPRP